MAPSSDLKWMVGFAILLQVLSLPFGIVGGICGLSSWFISTAVYWSIAGVILVRRRKNPTDLDILFAGFGYPLLVVLLVVGFFLTHCFLIHLPGT